MQLTVFTKRPFNYVYLPSPTPVCLSLSCRRIGPSTGEDFQPSALYCVNIPPTSLPGDMTEKQTCFNIIRRDVQKGLTQNNTPLQCHTIKLFHGTDIHLKTSKPSVSDMFRHHNKLITKSISLRSIDTSTIFVTRESGFDRQAYTHDKKM